MSHDHKHNNDADQRDYADKDVQLKPLWMFFIATTVTIGVVFLILRVVGSDLAARDFERTSKLPEFATARQLPPADMPRLQAQPLVELAVHQAYERNLIDGGVAWADAGKTKARIPVTNAMQILMTKPDVFPVRGTK